MRKEERNGSDLLPLLVSVHIHALVFLLYGKTTSFILRKKNALNK